MSLAEMKLEAIKKISLIDSEKTLQEVLQFLNSEDEKKEYNLSINYDLIKDQYSDVLQKLAQ